MFVLKQPLRLFKMLSHIKDYHENGKNCLLH